ncbi:MAG TPA: PQQ-dependent sugar dehydrogenase [Chitinophagaceae bacterium]
MLRTTIKLTAALLLFTTLTNKLIAQADCNGASPLTPDVNCTAITGNLKDAAGITSATQPMCGGTTAYGKWYKFSSLSSVTITINGFGSNINGAYVPYLQLLSGDCTGTLTSIACTQASGGTATITQTGLSPSTTYYVRVYTTTQATGNPANKWNFDICLQAAPNDDCAGAVTLTNATTYNTGSVWIATASSGIPAGCSTGDPDDDVWFKFTPAATILNVDLSAIGSNLSTSGARLQLFSGTCTGLTSVACGTTSLAATVTSGTPYYIRVYSAGTGSIGGTVTGSAFSITATATSPPANDECSNATTLTNGATNNAGTVWAASASAGIPVGCSTGTPDDDVWYVFTPSATNLNVSLSAIGTNLSASGTRVQLFSGSCAGLTSVACGTAGIVATVTAGVPYYIRVYSAGAGSIGGVASGSAFSITATAAASPANDECAGATTLTNGSATAGTVWLATTSNSIPVGCATGTPDDDVWYKFTPSSNVLTVSLSAIGTNLSTSGTRMQLFSGTCGTLTSIACARTKIVSNVTSGATYYIRIYSAGAGAIGGVASGSAFSITASATTPTTVTGGRMKEVYQQTTLSGANIIADPWEVTYGQDGYLWITEAKGYKVYRMDPNSGEKITVLDVSQGSTFFTTPEDQAFNAQFDINTNNPQGGFAGLALHPNFMHPSTPQNFVYVSYVHSYDGGAAPTGRFYTNRVVRFEYNPATEKLQSPVSLCDTLPGSNDHNSQRMIVAPVGGTYYLFYASGDMGSGQFDNRTRPQKAQIAGSYEGKILRFNLDTTGLGTWIPSDNPFGANSAVWSTGIRNNQGFAYDPATDHLYGSSHGPYSDDEINIIEKARNYGHPLVIGYAADSNYDGSSAGANTTSSCPIIVHEVDNAAAIGASYKDALFSAYPTTKANINNIYLTNPGNGGWPSEGWSGMDIYKNTFIPGWKNSLVVSSLKWGRVLKIKLNNTGDTVIKTAGYDTVSYFGSTNRFRDVAFGPGGKDLFVVMERSTTSSGPSAGNPIVPACAGCVQKYSFLGYSDVSGKSSIPTSIDVTAGTANSCAQGTTVTIDDINNNLWVPITGPDGNIMAEIKANGQNLGTITSSFYTNGGSLRQKSGVRYLDRNLTITPAVQPSSPVAIRLYFSKAEFDVLDADPLSGISDISGLKILKNNDACGASFNGAATLVVPQYAEAHGTNGYVLQANISGFSSFYFASQNIALPLTLLSFKGNLQGSAALLQWQTENEINTSHFELERSVDGRNFSAITTKAAAGSSATKINYTHADNDVANLGTTVVYYRLKMVDGNGSFTYSNIISITLPSIVGQVIVYPNPVEKETRVTINAIVAGKAKWTLVDNNGRVLMQNNKDLVKGYNEIQVDMGKLAAGVYYISVSGAGVDEKIKVQKR